MASFLVSRNESYQALKEEKHMFLTLYYYIIQVNLALFLSLFPIYKTPIIRNILDFLAQFEWIVVILVICFIMSYLIIFALFYSFVRRNSKNKYFIYYTYYILFFSLLFFVSRIIYINIINPLFAFMVVHLAILYSSYYEMKLKLHDHEP